MTSQSKTTPRFRFEPLRLEHKVLLLDWLARPHFRKWWGEPEAEWSLLQESIDTDDAKPFICCEGEEPIAYIQYWSVREARGRVVPEEEIWLRNLSDGAIGVDLSIGDGARLGQGLGREILLEFVTQLAALGFDEIYIDPDVKNLRAIKCYQAAGFTRIGQYPDAKGGTVLMRWTGYVQGGD